MTGAEPPLRCTNAATAGDEAPPSHEARLAAVARGGSSGKREPPLQLLLAAAVAVAAAAGAPDDAGAESYRAERAAAACALVLPAAPSCDGPSHSSRPSARFCGSASAAEAPSPPSPPVAAALPLSDSRWREWPRTASAAAQMRSRPSERRWCSVALSRLTRPCVFVCFGCIVGGSDDEGAVGGWWLVLRERSMQPPCLPPFPIPSYPTLPPPSPSHQQRLLDLDKVVGRLQREVERRDRRAAAVQQRHDDEAGDELPRAREDVARRRGARLHVRRRVAHEARLAGRERAGEQRRLEVGLRRDELRQRRRVLRASAPLHRPGWRRGRSSSSGSSGRRRGVRLEEERARPPRGVEHREAHARARAERALHERRGAAEHGGDKVDLLFSGGGAQQQVARGARLPVQQARHERHRGELGPEAPARVVGRARVGRRDEQRARGRPWRADRDGHEAAVAGRGGERPPVGRDVVVAAAVVGAAAVGGRRRRCRIGHAAAARAAARAAGAAVGHARAQALGALSAQPQAAGRWVGDDRLALEQLSAAAARRHEHRDGRRRRRRLWLLLLVLLLVVLLVPRPRLVSGGVGERVDRDERRLVARRDHRGGLEEAQAGRVAERRERRLELQRALEHRDGGGVAGAAAAAAAAPPRAERNRRVGGGGRRRRAVTRARARGPVGSTAVGRCARGLLLFGRCCC